MVLIFKNNKGDKKIVGYPNSNGEAFEMVNEYCLCNNKDIKYYRLSAKNYNDGKRITTYEFGSSSEFFYTVDDQYEKELLQK